MTQEKFTVRAKVNAPLAGVWMLFTTKEHIKQWNNATPDWHTSKVKIDLSEGGAFRYRMAAKDGSAEFDFEGEFDLINEPNELDYTLTDGRKVSVRFIREGGATRVMQTIEPEAENPLDMQRKGWQAILDHFKSYAEDQLSDDEEEADNGGGNSRRSDDDDDR